MKYYTPKKSNWTKAIAQANKVKKLIKAKEIINIRIARGGCFVARFFLGVKKIKGLETDMMCEIKVYDNLPYIKDLKNAWSLKLK